MPEIDIAPLVEKLAETAASLQAHIEARAREIAQPQIYAAQDAAASRIAGISHEAAMQKQRKDDLIKELRRQLAASVKNSERLNRENKAAREAIKRVESVRVWVNEDRKGFLFAEDVWAALGECGSGVTRYLASLDHGNKDEVAGLLGESGGAK